MVNSNPIESIVERTKIVVAKSTIRLTVISPIRTSCTAYQQKYPPIRWAFLVLAFGAIRIALPDTSSFYGVRKMLTAVILPGGIRYLRAVLTSLEFGVRSVRWAL